MDKSMFEIAKEIMGKAEAPVAIEDLLDEVMKEAGLDNDPASRAQLYIDITTSADFVYCGDNDLWDLKERQSLDVWDKSFYEAEGSAEDDEDDNDLTMDDYNYIEEELEDDEDEDSSDDEDEEEDDDDTEVYDVDAELEDEEDDDENSWDDDDEEKYNDMMDDYEDLYDDK